MEILEAALPDVQFWQTPTLNDMLRGESKKFPFTKTFEEAINEPLVIIHSSGSTGECSVELQGDRIYTNPFLPNIYRFPKASSNVERVYKCPGQLFTYPTNKRRPQSNLLGL